MNYQFLFLLLFLSIICPVNRHINHNRHNDNNKKKSIKSDSLILSKENNNCYCYKKYNISKLFFDFIELAPLLCKDFVFFVVDSYAINDKKDEIKAKFYNLSPENIWEILNSEEYFDCEFITMINDIYDKDEFILIYKSRMTIEFMVFAFNTKEKSIKYPYHYFNNVELKKVLHNLLDFTNKAYYLLEDKLSEEQIEDFKKFLHKYIAHKSINHMLFLNELKSFKHFLDIFFKEKGVTNVSFSQQIAMMNRFMTIFK